MKYARLFQRFFALAIMREAEYRTNFVLGVIDSVAQVALVLATYALFYRFADEIAGWTADEALLLLGVYWVFDGVWSAFFGSTLRLLGTRIEDGSLDSTLLRPASTQFLVSCTVIEFWKLSKVLVGAGLIWIAGERVGVAWSATAMLGAAAFGACGLALVYALRFTIATGTFWAPRIGELYSLFEGLYGAARYPVAYFERPFRDVLTYAVPVAFATTFPAQALLGEADWRLLPLGVALAGAALFASSWFWSFALRRYTSAGG
ncbi:MAG TPA: ABC-2 family transporter protein [Chloroflexota bacterium]|nr:ABC-2 family transporter protein [Chloroflexota bacterium]